MACCIWRTVVGDSSRASWLDVPKSTSCLSKRNSAEPGLSSFSAIGLGFAAGLDDSFFDLVFVFASSFSDADFEVDRFRAGALAVALALVASEVSFNGTLIVVAAVRAEKKSLVTEISAFTDLGAYCSVTRSVIVRGFFFGAFLFSGEDWRDAPWLPGTSTSYFT
jgi:hypothetical protein